MIWGAPQESKDQSGGRYSIGNLTPIYPSQDPEDLLRRIVGKIRDVPQGIQISRLNDSTNTGSIYVFQIHSSEHRPHQAEDKYYMRIGGEKRAAPHHYIEAMMKQIKYPRLAGQLNFSTLRFIKKGHNSSQWWIRVNLNVIIENESPFQNEESPRFILYCEHGTPLKGNAEWPTPQYPLVSRTTLNPNLEVIQYGERFQRRYSLGFDYDNLRVEGFNTDVALKYGGRFSPLKLIHYTLNLSFFDYLKYNEDQDYEIEYKPIKKENGLIVDSDYGEDYYELWDSIGYP